MSDLFPDSPVLSAMEKYRRLLEAKDVAAANRLIAHYRRSWKRMALLLDNLVLQIGDSQPTFGQVIRMERYKMLMNQIAAELSGLSALTADEVEQAGKLGITLGELHIRNLISITIQGTPELAGVFNKLPTETIETLLGFLDPAGDLYTRLNVLAPSTAEWVSRAILEGVTIGYNPRKIAAMVQSAFGRGLTDALRFVRTAQIWAYREASRAGMVANADIVDGWQWICDFGMRTCGSCFAMHGTIHSSEEVLNDHHNGRCRPAPIVKGYPPPVEESGEKWFRRQPEAFQRQVLGPGKYQALEGGAFEFSELTDIRMDPIYGPMRVETPLWKLLGVEPPLRTN